MNSRTKTGLRAIISAAALIGGLLLVVVAVRAFPPTEEEQRATADRLAGLLVVMDELGLDGWHDCATCQPIDIRPGASPAPLPSGVTAFEAMRAATVGVIPNGRLVEITSITPEAGDRVVEFTAVARSMAGGETGHDLWVWTWHEQPQSVTPDSLDQHWEFRAESAQETR